MKKQKFQTKAGPAKMMETAMIQSESRIQTDLKAIMLGATFFYKSSTEKLKITY